MTADDNNNNQWTKRVVRNDGDGGTSSDTYRCYFLVGKRKGQDETGRKTIFKMKKRKKNETRRQKGTSSCGFTWDSLTGITIGWFSLSLSLFVISNKIQRDYYYDLSGQKKEMVFHVIDMVHLKKMMMMMISSYPPTDLSFS